MIRLAALLPCCPVDEDALESQMSISTGIYSSNFDLTSTLGQCSRLPEGHSSSSSSLQLELPLLEPGAQGKGSCCLLQLWLQ